MAGRKIKMKKIFVVILVLTLILAVAACSSGNSMPNNALFPSQPGGNSADEPVAAANLEQTSTSSVISVEYDSDDLDSSLSSAGMSYITLKDDSITLDGSGATVDGSTITITSAGTYSISGALNDGQIKVDTQDKEAVKLVLGGVDVTCSTNAPIYIISAEKVVITLADGTENKITDGDSYVFEDAVSDEPNAAIFSHDDLTINGNGSLTVKSNYNNGIQSKDDLKIISGNINVSAINDGIKGRDSITIRDGNITVNTGGDGLQSNNNEDPERGYIAIEGGTLNITAGLDGIQAETSLVISGGNLTISSGGGSANSSSNIGDPGNTWGDWRNPMPGTVPTTSDTSPSAKGLKTEVNISITGGTIKIDSSDDSVHSNDSIVISGGNMLLTSGDDGIHADSTVEINSGEIDLTKSYEGIESAVITINDGNIHLVSSDDGINIVGGVDGSAIMGRPGQGNFASSGNNHLYINGGYIYIDANGDGIDVNGPIDMTAGIVIINGPTSNNNGALDHMGFNLTDGYLLAVGSSGMAQAPDASSEQYSVMYNFSSMQSSGTLLHIETEGGEGVLTFAPTKTYQSIVLSSPELKNGSTYSVYIGGSSTGMVTDGLYSGGAYTPGTQATNFTISGVITTVGSPSGGFPGGGFPGGGRR
jgi:hypothetical protein